MLKNTSGRPSFAQVARRYLFSLNDYREAKGAVAVVTRMGQDSRDVEFHAAQTHQRHQEAFKNLVDLAVRMREEGAA